MRTASPGKPVATLIDVALAIITLAIALLGVLGVMRAKKWAQKRIELPVWRILQRQLPQRSMSVVDLWLFLGLTRGPNNHATPLDVLRPMARSNDLTSGLCTSGIILVILCLTYWSRSAQTKSHR